MKKDYLKENLSAEEKAELTSIIWRVAKKHKIKRYAEQQKTVSMIDDIDFPIEDNYNFDNFELQSYRKSLTPLTEVEKTNIVNKLNMLMDELCLFNLKRALTFNEKLVFFLLSVQRYKGVEVMKLLSITKMTVYNRKKSIASKINEMIGGLSNEKKF
mgnify:CR=1 FL=1